MSLFPETIARSLAGGKVQCATLVRFEFTTETVRLWRGNGLLRTSDGQQWQAIGTFGSMSGIEQALNGEAPQATFTLSGIDAQIMRLARDEFDAEVRGRWVRVLIQFFGVDDPEDPGNQRCLDKPFPIWAGRCLSPTFAFTKEGERSVTLAAETLFSLRSRPRHAMNTDADQQKRFPGDLGFEFAPTLMNKVLTWPDF